jgi:hypothetical protein
MILNLNLPQEIRDEFQRLFEKEVDIYWNPFRGWLEGGCTAKLLDDYPTLNEEQEALLGKIINHEGQVFDEYVKFAVDQLDWREHHPQMSDWKDYPDSMVDDIIENHFD